MSEALSGLEERITKRIARKRADVFLRADVSDLGSYGQIGRALRNLVRKGRLIKIGHGIYARTQLSLIDGKPVLPNGLATLREALQRLGVEMVPSRAERAYNSGRSEQVPTGRVVAIRGKRVRRRIGYDGVFLHLERAAADREERHPKTTRRATAPIPLITVRDALRLLWEAERYPCIANDDWRIAARLKTEALAKAAHTVSSADDPPEFAVWLRMLLDRSPSRDAEREEVMSSLYDLFEPEGR